MPKRRWHPLTCKVCLARNADGVHISATGLCPECGDRIEVENLRQLRAHSGPYFSHWRQRIAASVGASSDSSALDVQAERR